MSSVSNSVPKEVILAVACGAMVAAIAVTILCVCCEKKIQRKGYESWKHDKGSLRPPLPLHKDDSSIVPQKLQHSVISSEKQSAKAPELPARPFSASQSVNSSSVNSESTISGILPAPSFTLQFSKNSFTYEELAMASDGFSDANFLGQGGFGYVHKGTLLDGKEVAIKQLKAESRQGEREFKAEVEIISRVHHKHLVSLVGFCISQGKRLLVYEFVQNNTLEFHLHETDRPTLDWPTRFKIALGSAKGLAYLHEDCNPKIIHRDIKSANILLDYKFEAKVADFGLARFAPDKSTHVSTRVMGTFGYMAPEYAYSGKLTDRSDVFSYGVMLLELITGKQPLDATVSLDESLVEWARPLLAKAMEEGHYSDLVDQRLGRSYNDMEMKRMIVCAAACVRHSSKRRPRMSLVLRALEGGSSLEGLNEGIQPGHSRWHDSFTTNTSTDYDSQRYNEEVEQFKRKMDLQSQVSASSEYSGTTSEYGLVPSVTSRESQSTREMDSGSMSIFIT